MMMMKLLFDYLMMNYSLFDNIYCMKTMYNITLNIHYYLYIIFYNKDNNNQIHSNKLDTLYILYNQNINLKDKLKYHYNFFCNFYLYQHNNTNNNIVNIIIHNIN